MSGTWYPQPFQDSGLITASGALIEYGGIPLNEAGRLYALAWSPSRIQGRQHQCMGYVPPYTYNQPGNLRFWEERDPYTQRLLAIKHYWQIAEGTRTIWMDDRPHPPAYAQHAWTGFATGKYEDNALTVYTTHLKRGWIRANGLAQRRSDSGGALHPPWRPNHVSFGCERSCLPRRAFQPDVYAHAESKGARRLALCL